MSKYEDEALELIELVAENSHHHAGKSFGGRSDRLKVVVCLSAANLLFIIKKTKTG